MTALAVDPAPPDDALFDRRCAGTDAAVAETLDALQAALAARLVDPARMGDLAIVLGEVLNNTVEHAMAGRDDGWIAVAVQERGDRLEVLVTDDGRALPPALLAGGDAALPEMGDAVEDLPEGGFGWFIIHTLVDDMTYEREDGVNRMSFSF